MLAWITPSNRRGFACVAVTTLALVLTAGACIPYLGVSSAAAATVTCASGTCSVTFGQAGATTQEWAVPNGLTEASFVVSGAGGGSDTYGGNGGPGGNGARVAATLPVTGGESLELLVGTGGQRVETREGGPGGYGGGGAGGTGTELGAAGGGGGSFVFRAQTPLIVAGGGGGAAVENLPGGNSGMNGAAGGNYESYSGGEGATQSHAGAGGAGFASGANGTGPTAGPGALGEGGAGEGGSKFAGGGGGGGYYGGGGGGGGGTGSLSNEYSNTGGGGGSSYVDAGTGVEYSSSGGAGGYGYENFNEESREAAPEPGSITISFAQPTTSVSLAASSLAPAVNSAETFTATVSPVPSSGTIAFAEGGSAVSGCASVAVDQNGEASCTTEYSSAGAHELLAEYSGSTDTVYPASTSAPLGVVATVPASPPPPPPPPPVIDTGEATTQTPTPMPAPAPAQVTMPVTTSPPPVARPAAVFGLSILTREAKPLINRHALAVRARCGAVACVLHATMAVELPGVRRPLFVGEADTALRAGEAGHVLIAVPPKLRTAVRSYLRHHRHAALVLQVAVTASATGHAPQTDLATLAVATYGGYR